MINTENLCPGCMNDNGGQKICPICGYDEASQNPNGCLPVKWKLTDRYSIGQTKKANGEGITYLAWDGEKDVPVHMKEYFPRGLAIRNPDGTVSAAGEGKYAFNEGLMEFLEVNRKIKEGAYPAVIPVTDVFEQNGTVYAAEQHIPAISMREFLKRNGDVLKWEQARPLFLPLIDTVKSMHGEGFVHGGISIDTIFVGRDGKLRLSGYGIRKLRMENGDIQTELFPGFAAIEQYKGKTYPEPCTDVYGLSAVLFRVLIGTVPPEAPDRLTQDVMSIPAKFVEELPRHVLQALANGLQVLPENRTKDIETFKNEFVYAETEGVKGTAPTHSTSSKSVKAEKKKGSSVKYVMISALCTALVFLTVIAVLVFTVFREDVFGSSSSEEEISSDTAPSIESIGATDSGAEESAVLFTVPDLKGKYYSELENDEELEKFKFAIKDKEFSDQYAKGQICAQSIAEGTGVVRDTAIEVTISLGPKEIKIANVVGLDETQAKVELLKQGFLYDNIEVLEKYDEDRKPGAVVEQEPAYGTRVNTDIAVKIVINSYEGNPDSPLSSEE